MSIPSDVDYISIDVDSTDVWLMHALLSGGYAPRVLSIEFNARRCAPVYSSTLYFPLDRATSRLNHASQVPDDGINGLVPPDDVHDWNLLWRSLTAGGFWRSNLSYARIVVRWIRSTGLEYRVQCATLRTGIFFHLILSS